jgi:hypothetical protein
MLYAAFNAALFFSSVFFTETMQAQGGRAGAVPPGSPVNRADSTNKTLDPRKRFAYDVVRSAVALPQGSPQDRLRVLAAAAAVISPIRPALAKAYSREGLRIEQEIIQRGETPPVSMLSAGPLDCKAVLSLVESIPPQRVSAAEPTLVAGIAACPAVAAGAEKLIDAGLQEKTLAPRATMALMEHAGLSSAWSQERFVRVFDALPSDAVPMQNEAPNLAALYAMAAGKMSKGVARRAGLEMLDWLGKLPESGDRTMAVNVTAGAMKQVLGDKENEDALASDVVARTVAQSAGAQGEISQPVDDPVNVLKAMASGQEDRMLELEALPPTKRAQEAAASGFASGTGGDPKLAERYFDLAFSSLNTLWSQRDSARNNTGPSPAAVVEEVSEAAAQVNSVDALQRAQQLDDTTAEAIGMIAVARVVASKQPSETTSASR